MIKLKNILSEKFNVQPGQVVTFKDMPPFKTPSQIKEEENSVNEMQVVNKKTGKDITRHVLDLLSGKIDKKKFEKLTGLKKESVNESPDVNSLKKIHDAVLKFLKTKKGVGEVKEFPEFPNRYGDNVSTFSVKYNIEDKYNYDLQEIKIEYSTSRVFIPNKGYFSFKTFNDIKNIINKKSSLKESVNEAKTYKKGDKLKIKLKNGKKFDVVFDSYSRTKGVALGKFKDGSGEYDTKPFNLDTIVESVNEADDHEVGMGLSALKESVRSAKIIYDEIKKRNIQELEGWVQHKLTLASDYLNTVAQYMEDLDEYDEKDK